jgi:hypothetical protein
MRPDVKSNLVKFQNNTMRAEQNNVYCMWHVVDLYFLGGKWR